MAGDARTGARHLALALTVCDEPNDVLVMLHSRLPAEVFELVLQEVRNVAQSQASLQEQESEPQLAVLTDELE